MEVQLLLFLTNMHMLYELFVNELGMDWFLKQKNTLVPRKAQHIESYRRTMLLTSLLKKLM